MIVTKEFYFAAIEDGNIEMYHYIKFYQRIKL